MARVREQLSDTERAMWEASPEGRAEQERAAEQLAATEAERAYRKKVSSVRSGITFELANPAADLSREAVVALARLLLSPPVRATGAEMNTLAA